MDWPVFLQTCSAVVGASTFVYGVGAWRRNIIGQKRIDLAVQTIVAFLEIQQAFREIRSPASHAGEGTTRQGRQGEDARDAEIGRMAYVAIERINNRSEKFITLAALRNQHHAYFGTVHLGPFNEADAVRMEIFRAALRLEVQWKKQGHQFRTEKEQEDHLAKMHAAEEVFWDSYADEDPLNPRIDKMVSEMESFCRQIIEPSPTFKAAVYSLCRTQRTFWFGR
ncbi:hypothetical protein [Neorhizobium galegae]|uniref:hypothetical protein n=1 Tax=Neorhizobium galegae TaxID=399 RepID=UPI001285122B|nr:hypothetical protein [Neorhizobium galegae]KAA9385700.1 hypothetical protein F4V88_04095 [Neorhizobium galegae]MCM2499657.1 hypothetical protein [Neorhizobium galegae]